jgi:type IV pilus assembly protein PilC
MFSNRVSLKQLAIVCRSLSTMLHSGLPVVKAFDLAVAKTSDPRLSGIMRDVGTQLRAGEDISTALRSHDTYFPTLMLDMIAVAEHTGALPEVLRALADHYENNLRLRKDFIGLIALPLIQFTAAVLIVAAVIWLLGVIAPNSEEMRELTFGLMGAPGALKWLGGWAILLTSLFIAWKVIAASLSGKRALHGALMRVPVIAHCMRSFAVARFSWAYYLTQQAGMPVTDSLDASLRATANAQFVAAIPQINGDIMDGEPLADALGNSDLFPTDFVQIVHVAETSGTVPEALERLSPQFEDQARRSLRALAITAGWAVWMMVAAFIIFLIFRMILWYVGMLNAAAQEALGG